LGILADRQGRILHRPLGLAMGDTRANQDNETNYGDEGVETGVIAHHPSHLRLAQLVEIEVGRRPGRSDSSPMLDFLLFAQQLSNFELERYRAAPVAFVDRLFLFHVSLDERVLDFRYPGSFFHGEICVSLHCRSPRNTSDDRAFSSRQLRGVRR
jgi:hypothetical protein